MDNFSLKHNENICYGAHFASNEPCFVEEIGVRSSLLPPFFLLCCVNKR